MQQDRDQLIRERAYHIWEREGRPHGREAAHWQQAASEIEVEERALAAQKPAVAPTPEEDAPVRSRPVTTPLRRPPTSEGQTAAQRSKSK